MRRSSQMSGFVLFDHESWHRYDVRVAMLKNGLKPMLSTSDEFSNLLLTIPEHQACFAVITVLNRRGLHGYNWMIEKAENLHSICPTLGIVFLINSDVAWRNGCMPPMVWIVNNALFDFTVMEAEVDLQKTEHCSQYREAGYSSQCGLTRQRKSRSGITGTIPNYNIKHPSLLAPLALMSIRKQREIYCEISPQEALTLYRSPYSSSTRDMVMHALMEAREAVSYANTQTGSSLKLHLDHCDDLYILEYAADIGFDSVMADGSARGLAQNIAFTKKAKSLLNSYNVSMEGEVGNIDGQGARRWNRTCISDFKRFLDETEADYVGVNIGQFHGFNYDYQKSREKHARIVGQRERFGGDDWNAFLMACRKLDDECVALNMSRACDERKLLADCATMALDSSPRVGDSVSSLLKTLSRKLPLRCQPLLVRLEMTWLDNRIHRLRLHGDLWSAITQSNHSAPSRNHARLDINLLEELADIVSTSLSNLVIHGGSSIAEDDLRQFPHYGVARVNFGTDVFKDYITQLASSCSSQASGQLNIAHGKQAFLEEYANDWRQWLKNPPEVVNSFCDRLIAQHLNFLEFNDGLSELISLEQL